MVAITIAYADRIQALANNPTWIKQVKIGELQSLFLFYAFLKDGIKDTTNIAPVVKPMHIPHTTEINDACTSQGLEPLVIPYTINQPTDPQLWDSNFCSIYHK